MYIGSSNGLRYVLYAVLIAVLAIRRQDPFLVSFRDPSIANVDAPGIQVPRDDRACADRRSLPDRDPRQNDAVSSHDTEPANVNGRSRRVSEDLRHGGIAETPVQEILRPGEDAAALRYA